MKYLLILLIPLSLLSQTPDYPDTLYLKSDQAYPCLISHIEESKVIFNYGSGREITLFFTGVDKIVLYPVGAVYTKESGFNKDLYQLQNIVKARYRNKNFQNSNSAANSKNSQLENWQLIHSNGDIISNFYLQNTSTDSIIIYQNGKTKFIAVESIVGLRKTAKSEFWESGGMGILAGAAAGILIQAPMSSGSFKIGPSPGEAALLGGIGGFLIGGVIGASSGEDEIYDLTHMTPKRKLKKIREILLKQ